MSLIVRHVKNQDHHKCTFINTLLATKLGDLLKRSRSQDQWTIVHCAATSDRTPSHHPRSWPHNEMDSVPDQMLISTLIDDLRKQRNRLWVKPLILSLSLGLFATCTAVLAVLYGMRQFTS